MPAIFAFDTSLETIEAELENVAALGRDLVVLSTGDLSRMEGHAEV